MTDLQNEPSPGAGVRDEVYAGPAADLLEPTQRDKFMIAYQNAHFNVDLSSGPGALVCAELQHLNRESSRFYSAGGCLPVVIELAASVMSAVTIIDSISKVVLFAAALPAIAEAIPGYASAVGIRAQMGDDF